MTHHGERFARYSPLQARLPGEALLPGLEGLGGEAGLKLFNPKEFPPGTLRTSSGSQADESHVFNRFARFHTTANTFRDLEVMCVRGYIRKPGLSIGGVAP